MEVPESVKTVLDQIRHNPVYR